MKTICVTKDINTAGPVPSPEPAPVPVQHGEAPPPANLERVAAITTTPTVHVHGGHTQ